MGHSALSTPREHEIEHHWRFEPKSMARHHLCSMLGFLRMIAHFGYHIHVLCPPPPSPPGTPATGILSSFPRIGLSVSRRKLPRLWTLAPKTHCPQDRRQLPIHQRLVTS